MKCMHEPIKGKPNMIDDDTINRGITGQCLREEDMQYDPATGLPTSEEHTDVNLKSHKGGMPSHKGVPSGY